VQLKEEDITLTELVQYSLLPRVIPRRDQREPDEAVTVVCATPHPKYIPFKEPVYLSYGKEIKEALEEAREEMFLPTSFMKEMDRFEEIRDEVNIQPGISYPALAITLFDSISQPMIGLLDSCFFVTT
jgi:hypothetical protein